MQTKLLEALGVSRSRASIADAANAAKGSDAALGEDEDAVVAPSELKNRSSTAAVEKAFAQEAHQGGNAYLASKRKRDATGKLIAGSDPIYFPAAEVPAAT